MVGTGYVHGNRTAVATLRRKSIADLAAARNKASFGRFLSAGPYCGISIVEAGQRHRHNGDEGTLGPASAKYAGNFSKGLQHDHRTGLLADNTQYDAFRSALEDVARDETFPGNRLLDRLDGLTGFDGSARKLVNPLAGAAADTTGLDPFGITMPPAPRLEERRAAVELIELYWMALLRDVPFEEWHASPLFAEAVRELDEENGRTKGDPEQFALHYVPKDLARPDGDYELTDKIGASTALRGAAPGNSTGGFISQFLLQDVPFGTIDYAQKQKRLRSLNDYMIRPDDWLAARNGANVARGRSDLEDASRARHIVTLRDLAHYVHFDALHEAYFNAALILDGLGARRARATPYPSKHQDGFGTYGGPHLLTCVTEVATRALKVVWHQKWFVHRRLRPEAMGGRVEFGRANADVGRLVHRAALQSKAAQTLLSRNGTAFLPMAFPEGSPMHPSYGAGHATVAGACVTVLKAFFESKQALPRVVQAVRTPEGGSRLEEVAAFLTVGGELNKLAANIAIGRNAAGVHYRTDYTKSLALGEAVAIALLQEQAMTMREGRTGGDTAWRLENFSGKPLRITFDGCIHHA